jgi:Cu/Ag efflux pump CusA
LIGTAIGGRVAGLVFEGDRRFQIIVRLSDALRSDVGALENLPVPLPPKNETAAASSVPLRSLATFEQTEGANQISRENGKRRVVATAEIRGREEVTHTSHCVNLHGGIRILQSPPKIMDMNRNRIRLQFIIDAVELLLEHGFWHDST